MTDSAAATLGFIGAGQLGEPMVRRLLDTGREVVVFARRDDVRLRLSEVGGVLADSVAEVAARSDVLVSCLFSDGQLRELASGSQGFVANARPGAVFVSHTTGAASTLLAIAEASPKLTVLDAPVSGTADHIRRGELTVLIGGAEEAVNDVTPILAAYADPIIPTGVLGSALNVKLMNNLLFAANAQLATVALQLGSQLDIDPRAFLSALAVCSGGSAASSYIQMLGGAQEFAEGAAPFLAKDVATSIAVASGSGIDLGLLHAVAENGPLPLTGEAAS